MHPAQISSCLDELHKIAYEQEEEERGFKPRQHALVGAGALYGAGLLASNSKPLISGRTKLFHGTDKSGLNKILKHGLRPGAATGFRGSTDMLGADIKSPSKDLAFATPKKRTANAYSLQQQQIKQYLAKNPNATGSDIHDVITDFQSDPTLPRQIANPFIRKNVAELNVPMWKPEIASKLRENPEARGSFDNFHNHVKTVMAKDNPLINHMPEAAIKLQTKALYDDLTKNTRAFAGGIGSEYIRGSKHYKPLSLGEVRDYAKTKPFRFAGGVALGTGALALTGLGAHQLYKAYKKNKELKASRQGEANASSPNGSLLRRAV